MKTLSGSELGQASQREALAKFVHRFTMDHVPRWAMSVREDGSYYAPHFASDIQWLDNTEFSVTDSGALDQRATFCTTHGQTWPLGQSLTAPYRRAISIRKF